MILVDGNWPHLPSVKHIAVILVDGNWPHLPSVKHVAVILMEGNWPQLKCSLVPSHPVRDDD